MSDKELTETCEWQTLSFIDDILRNDSVHKSVVNFGCSYVRAESTLCKKIPDVQWTMLDLETKLDEVNAVLEISNADFISCYPLDWLVENEDTRKFDIALFNRVMVLFTNAELRAYIKTLSKNSNYIVFCEVASVLRFTRSVNVDEIDSNASLPARGGMMIHNYRQILKEHGFEMIHYAANRTPVHWHGKQHFLIIGVAKSILLT